MQRIDEKSYRKYFSQRRDRSKWSEKNKALAERLEQQGLMTDFGRQKMEEARQNGRWNAPKAPAITEEQIAEFSARFVGQEPAYTHFQAMPLSVKKTYTKAYLDAKTDAGREKRLAWIVDRLHQNRKPM